MLNPNFRASRALAMTSRWDRLYKRLALAPLRYGILSELASCVTRVWETPRTNAASTPDSPRKIVDKPINGGQLHRLLSSPYYKGLVLFGGALYPGNHEPLVDEALWQRV
jgi:hypothetical protein